MEQEIELVRRKAALFRARKNVQGVFTIFLGDSSDDRHGTELKGGADVSISACLERTVWTFGGISSPDQSIVLRPSKIEIGRSSVDEPSDSAIANDWLFVIDGDSVRPLIIESIHLNAPEDFEENHLENERLKKLMSKDDAGVFGWEKSQESDENDDIKRRVTEAATHKPYAIASFDYLAPNPGFWLHEYCQLAVGIPNEVKEKIFELGSKGMGAEINFRGYALGLTSQPHLFGLARDLFLVAGDDTLDSIKFNISSISIEATAPKMKEDKSELLSAASTIAAPQVVEPIITMLIEAINRNFDRMRLTVAVAACALGLGILVTALRNY